MINKILLSGENHRGDFKIAISPKSKFIVVSRFDPSKGQVNNVVYSDTGDDIEHEFLCGSALNEATFVDETTYACVTISGKEKAITVVDITTGKIKKIIGYGMIQSKIFVSVRIVELAANYGILFS